MSQLLGGSLLAPAASPNRISRGNDRPLVGPQNGGDSDALCVPILKREHILLPDDSRVLLYVGFCLENILRQSRIIDTHAVDGAVVGISE